MTIAINLRRYEEQLKDIYQQIEEVAYQNQMRVLHAFREFNVRADHFRNYTGYGYDDAGRDVMEKIWAQVFGAEDALVRSSIISGTHALTLALAALLKPGDELCSLVGAPYDTLQQVIGTRGQSEQTLIKRGIRYKELPLLADGRVDKPGVKKAATGARVVLIQRSRGYSWRPSLTGKDLAEIINLVHEANREAIILVDNCYGEFVENREPCAYGADLIAGSLIKNPGGGLIPGGGYVAGRNELVGMIAEWLTAPGLGKEVGPTLIDQRLMFQGLFMAPSIVANALKGAVLIAKVMQELGYEVSPEPHEKRGDIVQAVKLGSPENVLRFCQTVQDISPVDNRARLEYGDMPGYDEPVVMAAGTFVQGSSIELSCDAPLREPYIAFWQGGLTYEHAKGVVEEIYRRFQ